MIGIKELCDDQILPEKVNLVYETVNGAETETITVNINNYWSGSYEGAIIGDNLLSAWIYPPQGYERPDDLFATVVVKVEVSQSDNRALIKDYTAIDSITLTEDEHIVYEYQLFEKYLRNKSSDIILPDGEVLSIPVTGWSSQYLNQFDGAVPDTYNMDAYIELPAGYLNKTINYGKDSVNLYYSDDIRIPFKAIVQTAQTMEQGGDIVTVTYPDTTQPKFSPLIATANIESVSFSDYPTEFYAGEVIDFNDYLIVIEGRILFIAVITFIVLSAKKNQRKNIDYYFPLYL